MLDAFIIEQIKKREEERQREEHRPGLQLPIPEAPWPEPKKEKQGYHDPAYNSTEEEPTHDSPAQRDEDEGQRGVIIIDL